MSESGHQFAAVLFSDIEGYTSMIQKDEESAIEKVNRYQKELENIVHTFNGEVKQHYGDGSLTMFPTALDAVRCGYQLQRKLQGSIPLRIGIHYGRVILQHQKIFGDTVNIASRIESLGQPGAVLFSEDVYKEIESLTEFESISMGGFQFKNVNREIEVFALTNQGLVLPKAGSLKGKLEPKKSSIWPFVLSGLLGFLLLAVLIVNGLRNSNGEGNMLEATINPSIAVLPFTNLSTDTTQEYFAYGLAQEVLNMLTQDPQLRVISRSSSFSFGDQSVDIPAIAEKLGVQYILDGSVQKAGDSVKIRVQLVNAERDEQVWAEAWQRNLVDIFSLQLEIADSVKTALQLQLSTLQNGLPQATDPEAYSLFLQARHVGQQGSVQGLGNAEYFLGQALKIDSLYAPAWAYLSYILSRQSNIGVRPSSEGYELARQAAHKALSIDSTLSSAWSTLVSTSIYYDRNFQEAEYFLNKAREFDPQSLNILKLASNLAFCLGNIEQAIALDQQSTKIDPVDAKNYLDQGYGYFCDGQFQLAEQVTRQGLLMNPGHLGGPYLLSLILMEQGKLQEADEIAETEPYEILRTHALSLIAHAREKNDSSLFFLQEIKDQYAKVAPYQIAQVYGNQKQVDSAFKWLELAYQYRDGGLVQVKADPFMTSLKGDPRWEQLIQKMNFPN